MARELRKQIRVSLGFRSITEKRLLFEAVHSL